MITLLWGIFTIIFIVLAIFHFVISKKKLNNIQFKGGVKSVIGTSLGIKELAEDINNFIDDFNKTSTNSNIIAMIGYIAAALTSLISLFLTL